MTRNELEHIIRAAGAIADVTEIIILGSQSILAQFPELSEYFPEPIASEMSFVVKNRGILFRSIEADIMVADSAEKTEMIEGTIGELSAFHHTFGYYAQGVDETTSILPAGWKTRLIEIRNENTHGVSGRCLEVHDLVISKLCAGRKKDIEFFQAAVRLGILSEEILIQRLDATQLSGEQRKTMRMRIERGFVL
ncbi:MAG: hypothetical protein O2954_03690 [bacterium]|nr:hypothetical protein [bacterium]